MNKVHKLVRGGRLGQWVAVSEDARSAGSAAGSAARCVRRVLCSLALAIGLPAAVLAQAGAPAATTLPQGGRVVQGQASLHGAGSAAAPVLRIDQTSPRAVIDWQRFDLGSAATVRFDQPGAQSATLNRVQEMAPSRIFGRIEAPGQVTLVNPAGVYFAPGSVLDVGALTATTMQQSDADFMAGRSHFRREGSSAGVVNEGTISAGPGGYVALLAPEVRNQGVILARAGAVALAGGEAVTLNFDADSGLSSVTVTPARIATLIENRHAVQAPDGLIVLSTHAARGLAASVVNAGELDASSVSRRGGRIVLEGDAITLAGGSRAVATGPDGGGTVLVGGGWQGGGGLRQATTVTMQADATIDVSATGNGDGGTAVLWSDLSRDRSVTRAAGRVLAQGGREGGDGGRVETSGHQVDIDGFRVDTLAARGRTGSWLIDPYDYAIDASQAATIGAALNTSDVTISTQANNSSLGSNGNSGSVGNIYVNQPIVKTGAATTTLTLQADRAIWVHSTAPISSSNGPLNVVLLSDFGNQNLGGANLLSDITTRGGHVWIGGSSSASAYGSWNGLQVGTGPSVGSASANTTAMSLDGNIDTRGSGSTGGDVLIWAGAGVGSYQGIGLTNSHGISTGSGDITLLANRIDNVSGSGTLGIDSGGTLTLAPGYNGAWAGTFDWTGSSSGGRFTLANIGGGGQPLAIENVASLGGLAIGRYTGMSGVTLGNTANVSVSSAIGIAGPVSIAGGTVNLGAGVSTTSASTGDVGITATDGLSGSGAIALADGRTLTVTQAGSTTYGGAISGTQAAFVKAGAGDLTLSGASSYGGSTTVSQGVLSLAAANRLPDGTALTVESAGTFSLNGFGETVGSIAGSGLLVNGAVNRDGLVLWLDAGNTSSYSGSGTQWTDLSGFGRHATLYGNPTYSAATSLFSFTAADNSQYARIAALPADFLGSTVSGVTVFTVANFGNSSDFWERVVDLGNRGASGNSASNNIVLSRHGTDASRLNWEIYNGVAPAATENKIGINTAISNSTKASYAGTADGSQMRIFRDGTLNTSTASTALPSAVARADNFIGRSNWEVDQTFRGDIGTLMVYNRALSAAEIAKNHQLLFNRAEATLTVGGNGTSTTFSGKIENGVGTLNLVKAGSGTLTLSGSNSYAGSTTVTAGTLRNGRADAVPTRSVVSVASGATWDLNGFDNSVGSVTGAGSITLGAGTLTTGGLNTSTTFSGTLSGTGGLVKTGSGSFTLSGTSTHSGATTMSAGTLASGAANSLSDASAFTVASGASLALNSFGDSIGSLAGAGSVTLGSATLTTGGNGGSTTFSGGVSGTGGLTKAGAGTMTLTGSNSYSGATLVSAGTLAVGNGGTLGSGAVTTQGALVFDRSGDVALSALASNAAGLAGSGSVSATAAGRLTVDRAIGVGGAVTLRATGGNLVIDSAVASSGAALTLSAGGTLTDGVGGSLSAPELALTGGDVVLDASSSNVGTLAASGVSRLQYLNGGALTIGSVGATSGIGASGDIGIATASGNLTVAAGIATSATTSSALVLNAGRSAAAGTSGGGDLILSGSPTLVVGSGGRGTLYTGSVSGSSGLAAGVGSASGRFRYGSDESSTAYTLALGIGLHGIFRQQPTLSMAVDDRTMTYGETRPADSLSYGGLVNGDTAAQALSSQPTVAAGGSSSGSGHLVAGSHTLSAAGAVGRLGYALGSPTSGTLTVQARTLEVDLDGVDKTYDGNDTASVDTADDRLSGDTLSVTVGSARFADADAGSAITISASGLGLSGADAGNYVLASTSGSTSATIERRSVSVSGLSVADKTYDGSTAAEVVSWGTVSTGVGSQTLRVSAAVASFSDANADDGKTVTASGYSLADGSGGGLARNYVLTSTSATTTATITPRTVTVSGLTVADKVYDGSTTAIVTDAGRVSTGVGSQTLSVSAAAASFADANAGDGKTVTATGYSLADGSGGGLARNYVLASTSATTTADIAPKPLTALASAADKVYDGNTSASVSLALQGLVGSETLGSVAVGSFDSRHVAEASEVRVDSVQLLDGSGLARNYSLAPGQTAAARITPKPLQVAGADQVSKIYDGNTEMPRGNPGHGALDGVVSGDTVGLRGAPVFDAAGAGSRSVLRGDLALSGAQAGNYELSWQDGSGEIERAPLTVRANDDARFVTLADTSGYAGVGYAGFVNGETATVLRGSLQIVRSNAATGTAGRHVGVLVPGGLSADNYRLDFEAGDYTIVPAEQLLVRVSPVASTYGSEAGYQVTEAQYLAADNSTIVDLSDHLSADGNRWTVGDPAGGSTRFTVAPQDAQRSSSGRLAVGHWQLGAVDVSDTNPNLAGSPVVVGSQQVTRQVVTLASSGALKVYDGSTGMDGLQLALGGVQAGDRLGVVGQGSFDSRHAGSGLGYSVAALQLQGADAGQYLLTGGTRQTGSDGVITPRTVTLAAPTVGRAYDGSRVFTASASMLAALGESLGVAGDTVTGIRLDFDDKNAGDGKTLTASQAVIDDGRGGANYRVLYAANHDSRITRRASVRWVGGTSGDWFDPRHWEGGAVPDLGNVREVLIPEGVSVSFGGGVVAPAESGPVNIDRLGNEGRLQMGSGRLAVGRGGMRLDSLDQTGGTFTSEGDVNLGRFSQTGGTTVVAGSLGTSRGYTQHGDGSVEVGGRTVILGTEGDVVLGRLRSRGGLDIDSRDGDIRQRGGTTLEALDGARLRARRQGEPADILLGNPGNDFVGRVHADGRRVVLSDANELHLGTVRTTGHLGVSSGGALNLGDTRVGGDLDARSAAGGIGQDAPLHVEGRTRLDSGRGTISLPLAGNHFGGGLISSSGTAGINDPASAVNDQAYARLQRPDPMPPAADGDAARPLQDHAAASLSAGIVIGGDPPAGLPTDGPAARPDLPEVQAVPLRGVSAGSSGLALVQLPAAVAQAASFLILLPPQAAEVLGATAQAITATRADGSPLPDWLRFDATSLRFTASHVPDGGLPLQIRLSNGAGVLTMEIALED